MTQVKKAFQPLVDFLEANKDVKVKTILEQVIELTQAKTSRSDGNTFLKDAAGNTVAILDYYFKTWCPLVGSKAVEFGAKQKTSTGFNTMSKAGVSAWTKQQREAKQAGADLLKKVASGEVSPKDITAHQASIEESRKAIHFPVNEAGEVQEVGFATMEDLMKYLKKEGIEVAAPAA